MDNTYTQPTQLLPGDQVYYAGYEPHYVGIVITHSPNGNVFIRRSQRAVDGGLPRFTSIPLNKLCIKIETSAPEDK